MDKWEKQEVQNLDLSKFCESFYYYKRKMGCGPATQKTYNASVFICTFSHANQLLENWKEINYMIAFHVQSKNTEIIEKSNYYICLFVKENIALEQKNIIQGNSFCAKKYIFEEDSIKETECLQKIEQKVFSISLEKNVVSTHKIEMIELQNFRGYEGRFKVNLTGKNLKPAAFTLIYAKNGYGKTSLFDGIEYVLKGEVSRIADLEEVNKKEPMKGPVYHNKNRSDKNAYVSIMLDNGKELRRNVPIIQCGKNDCRINPVGKNWGQDVVGLAEERDKWNRIILPHDKIDSFISARTPSEKYVEWTKSAPDLQTYQVLFIHAHENLREQQIKIEKKQIELLNLQKELKNLEKSKIAIFKINELCEQYNTMAKEENKLFFDVQNSNVESYDSLLNKIFRIIRNIKENILPLYEYNLSVVKEIEDINIKDSNSLENLLKKIQEKKETCINQQKKNKQYKETKRYIEKLQSEIFDLEKEKVQLDAIYEFGLKRVDEAKNQYIALNKEINAITDTINYFEEEIQKIRSEQSDLSKKIDSITKVIHSEEIKNIVKNKIKNIYEIQKQIIFESHNLQNKKAEIVQINTEIDQIQLLINRINLFVLPTELNQLCMTDMIGQELVLSKEDEDILKWFEIHSKELQKELEVAEELHNQENVVAEEIREICKSGIDFLLSHREQIHCPLCNTTFRSWEELFGKVSRIEEIRENKKQQKIELLIERIIRLDADYKAFCVQCSLEKDSKQADLMDEIITLNKRKSEVEIQQEKYQMKIELLQNNIKDCEKWIEDQGICITNYSLEAWSQYLNEKTLELEELYLRKGEVEKKEKHLINLTISNRRTVDLKLNEKENIVNDSQLYSYVLFLLEKPDCYNLEYERNIQRENINVLKLKKEEKENFLISNESYAHIDLIEIEDTIEKCNKELENLYELKKKTSIFNVFSPKGIEECLVLWMKEKEDYIMQLELLNQMREENGARLYFEKYKIIQKRLETTQKDIQEREKKEQKLKEKFEEEKDKLEVMLKDYFSQTVMSEIYQKIDPHDIMKNISYHLDFSEKNEPQLFIKVCELNKSSEEFYRPEVYFSTAQLNTVAFSSFFGRALTASDMPIKTICIDDPIGHFDDMNILGFTDMIRSILETQDCQIIMSTHDEKVFQIMERKLDDTYYNTSFIRLEKSEKVEWNKEIGLEIE